MGRNKEVDIIKGLCMFTIVFRHTGNAILWFCYIYLYGFYFVGGYTFKDKPIRDFIKSKICGLYIPFVIACICGSFIVKMLSKIVGEGYGGNFELKYIIKNSICFNIPNDLLAPAWFVFPLFIILFLYYFLNKLVKNYYIIWSIAFIIFLLSNLYKDQLANYYWNNCAWLLNVGWGFFVFSTGHVLKNNKMVENILFNGKYSIDLFVTSTAILYMMWKDSEFQFDLRAGICSNVGFNLLAIFFGMYFLIYFSKLLAKSKIMNIVFSAIGRYSMTIMFFHILSFSLVTLSVHRFVGLPFPGYWAKAYTDGRYGTLSAMVGIAVPLTGAIIYNHLKMLARNYFTRSTHENSLG